MWTKKQLREHAREVLGRKWAEHWWRTGNIVFDGQFPEDLLETDEGRLQILQELNAMYKGEPPDTHMGS